MPSKGPDLATSLAWEITAIVGVDPESSSPLVREIRAALATYGPVLTREMTGAFVPLSVDPAKLARSYRQFIRAYENWALKREFTPPALRAKVPPASMIYGEPGTPRSRPRDERGGCEPAARV